MRASHATLLLLGLASVGYAGARAPAMAPTAGAMAPGAASKAVSDLTFIVTADNATFKTPTMLKLGGVAEAVPYFSGQRVSTMSTGVFADNKPGSQLVSSDGMWLDAPQALLYGTDKSGNLSAVALNLQSVKFYNVSGMLKFNVTLVPLQTADLKLKDGPVSTAITDSDQGTGPKLATMLAANSTWTAVTLVVESTRTALKPMAETKGFGICFGNCGYGGGWGGGWGGYNNGWGGYNNGWGGYNRGGWYGRK